MREGIRCSQKHKVALLLLTESMQVDSITISTLVQYDIKELTKQARLTLLTGTDLSAMAVLSIQGQRSTKGI